MEVHWFILSNFFLYYFSSSSFANDVVTCFKEGVAKEKKQYFLFLELQPSHY
jgi:hypothetical protein